LTQRVSFFDPLSGKEIKKIFASRSDIVPPNLSFSSEGSYLAAASVDPQIWDTRSGRLIYEGRHSNDFKLENELLTSDGNWLVFNEESFVPPDTFSKFFVVNVKTKDANLLSTEIIHFYKFSNDSKYLFLIVSKDIRSRNNVKVYDVANWTVEKNFASINSISKVADVSPDNTMIASGDTDGKFSITSLLTGAVLAEEFHYKRTRLDDILDRMHMITQIIHVEFSPDGTVLLTGGEDGSVKLWRLISAQK